MPVIKSKEYKDPKRLGKKIHYIFTQKLDGSVDSREQRMQEIDPFMFTLYNGSINVDSDDIEGITHDMYEQIEKLPERKNGAYYAENYINFSGKDFDFTNHNPDYVAKVKHTMADITRKWVELRGIESTTWIARPHFDTDNAHVHLLFSKNERDQSKRKHLSRSAFLKAQNELNNYQLKHHPDLKETFQQRIEPANRQRAYQKDMRQRMDRLNRPPTVRQRLSGDLEKVMPRCESLNSIALSMKKKGFEVYHRGGIPYGIIHNEKRYRFGTLLKGTSYEKRIKAMMATTRAAKQGEREAEKVMRQLQQQRKLQKKRSQNRKPRL